MKKFVVVLLCLMMVLSLVACRASNQKGEEKSSTNGQTEAPTVPTDPINNTSSTPIDHAVQMYEAAIRNEIKVFDERMGETSLKNLLTMLKRIPFADLDKLLQTQF